MDTARPAKQAIVAGANFAGTKLNLVALANSNSASKEGAFQKFQPPDTEH